VCICTRLGASRLHWSDSGGGWGQLPLISHPRVRTSCKGGCLSSQSVLFSVQFSRLPSAEPIGPLFSRSSRPQRSNHVRPPALQVSSQQKHAAAIFSRGFNLAPAFELLIYFPRGPPSCSMRHFFACASAPEVLLVWLERELFECV
jgi:hypothetical protein